MAWGLSEPEEEERSWDWMESSWGRGGVSEEMCPGAYQTADAHQGRRWTPGTAPGQKHEGQHLPHRLWPGGAKAGKGGGHRPGGVLTVQPQTGVINFDGEDLIGTYREGENGT